MKVIYNKNYLLLNFIKTKHLTYISELSESTIQRWHRGDMEKYLKYRYNNVATQ